MNFSKVSDEELKEYADSLLKGDERYDKHQENEDIISLYKKTISSFCTKISKINANLKNALLDVEVQDFIESYDKCMIAASRLEKICMELKRLPSKYGDIRENRRVEEHKYHIEFEYINNITKIILPELLPKKAVNGTGIAQNYDFMRNCYYTSFIEEMEAGRIKGYREKVILKYTNVYEKRENMYDHDNLDQKIINDIITTFFLIDDNPVYCDIYMTYKMGNKEHTEIEIIPDKELKK